MTNWNILSCDNRFITAQKAVGGKGFKASWTEIREPGSSCNQFRCASSGYCISSSLYCNDIRNCGNNDQSDEINCKLTNGIIIRFNLHIDDLSSGHF